jgi:hypothetical protein
LTNRTRFCCRLCGGHFSTGNQRHNATREDESTPEEKRHY